VPAIRGGEGKGALKKTNEKKKENHTTLLTINVLLFFFLSKPWHGGKLSNFDSQFELIEMHTRPIVDIKNLTLSHKTTFTQVTNIQVPVFLLSFGQVNWKYHFLGI